MTVLTESNFSDVEVLKEGEENKAWYIRGTFLQADVVNRNRRIYPGSVMEKEISQYQENYVRPGRAVGELSHPKTTEINLDKISHLIENIEREGTNYIGRAKVLDTPTGQTVQGLLEGGVKLGVSSRAGGSVKRNSQGINEVQDDFKLSAVDIVWQPSAPGAFVDGLMEGVWDTITEDEQFVENMKEEIKESKKRDLMEAKFNAFVKWLEHCKN